MPAHWGELTGKAFEGIKKDVAILPVGTVERHGNHLPLGTDYIIPEYLAARVAEALGEGAVVMPTIPYGVSTSLSHLPGTIDVGYDAFMAYVEAVLREVARNGFRAALVINGHGGNTRALHIVAKRVAFETGIKVGVVDWWADVAQEVRERLFTAPGHAGEDETAAVLAIRPDLVDMGSAEEGPSYTRVRVRFYDREATRELFAKGVTGDPRRADAERGREFLDAVVKEIVEGVREALTR